ncbi:Choline-sulfatase [Labilithrix luteola]|uniref:Choline-sulfatase n=1 Tax=Labilithrix luteola TaxID=1391654 RepID=A0A0K1Q9T9_9BACT|nr:sulfatase [Labilithrix luteola]AKV02498.1 Choline-sulfatase [Labilithrix luteola]
MPLASSSAPPLPSAKEAPSAVPAKPPANLNVLVLSIDSLRADMPWAGYPRAIAPRLTELEKRSVSYTRAYAISSYTSMSLGGFLGGRLPSELKRSGYFFGTYPEANLFFPEILAGKGIRTLSAHAHAYFNSAGFNQGFDKYEIVPGIKFDNTTDPNVTSPQHEAIAERLLSDPALDTTRFFAWFHFLDPHDQYLSHEKDGIPPYGKTLRDRYDAEVTFTDQWLGKLFDFVESKPWGKHTAIVITSDHGEGFGEHGRYSHGFEIWENLVRIPLFVMIPGVTPRRIDTPRSTLDLAPTILELFGLPPEPSFTGKSLVPEFYGGAPEERDVIVDLPMTSNNDKRRALVHGKWKIMAFGKEESLKLFDLEADPQENSPILRGEDFDAMAKRYRAFSKTVTEVAPYACGENCLNGAYEKKKAAP